MVWHHFFLSVFSRNVCFCTDNEAYEVLSNAEKRRIYDQHGEAGLKQQQQGGSNFHDPFDIFSQYDSYCEQY